VRDEAALEAVATEGVAKLGRLYIVIVNAGIATFLLLHDLDDSAWQDVIDINQTGVWNTSRAAGAFKSEPIRRLSRATPLRSSRLRALLPSYLRRALADEDPYVEVCPPHRRCPATA